MREPPHFLDRAERWAANYRAATALILIPGALAISPGALAPTIPFALFSLLTAVYVHIRPHSLPRWVRAVMLVADAGLVGLWSATWPELAMLPVLFAPVVIAWTAVYGARWGALAVGTSVTMHGGALYFTGASPLTLLVEQSVIALVLVSIAGTIAGLMHLLRAEAARATKEATTRLREQGEHEEGVGRLAGSVAHEMNNTLTAILGLASLMQHDAAPGTPLYDDLEALVLACRDGQVHVENLLGMTGRGDLHLSHVEPEQLIGRIAQMLAPSLPSHVNLKLEIGRALPLIEVDEGAIARAILNVVANAVEASAGIPVSVTLCASVVRLLPNEDHELADGLWVRIDIKDDGPGLQAAGIRAAFDPLYTTKGHGDGGGLGLPQVRQVLLRHQGTARINSRPGASTKVTMWLPAYGFRPSISDLSDPRAEPSCILVVEDDAIVLRAIVRQLHALGHEVLTAKCGATALDMVQQHTNIRVVILDLGLPNRDGADVLVDLRAVMPHAHIVISSGLLPPEAQVQLRGRGATGFLPKPYDLGQLTASLA